MSRYLYQKLRKSEEIKGHLPQDEKLALNYTRSRPPDIPVIPVRTLMAEAKASKSCQSSDILYHYTHVTLEHTEIPIDRAPPHLCVTLRTESQRRNPVESLIPRRIAYFRLLGCKNIWKENTNLADTSRDASHHLAQSRKSIWIYSPLFPPFPYFLFITIVHNTITTMIIRTCMCVYGERGSETETKQIATLLPLTRRSRYNPTYHYTSTFFQFIQSCHNSIPTCSDKFSKPTQRSI